MRGTGPWLMTAYEPSVRIQYERNPNYWNKDLPVLDKVEMFIISDQSQREAQFLAGRIDGSTSPQSPPSVPAPESSRRLQARGPRHAAGPGPDAAVR